MAPFLTRSNSLVHKRSHHMSPIPKLRNSILLILFATTLTFAQTFRGTILGTVSDPNGAVVAGAKVTARNTSTGLERSTTTDEAGNYTIPELPIGTYEVRVEQTGFANAVVGRA